jgi:hypothetical protein
LTLSFPVKQQLFIKPKAVFFARVAQSNEVLLLAVRRSGESAGVTRLCELRMWFVQSSLNWSREGDSIRCEGSAKREAYEQFNNVK